jgi:Protein of unknown function (DUF1573)
VTDTEETANKKKPLSWTVLTLIITSIGLGSIAAVAIYVFGSIGSALAYFRGDRLIADAYTRSVGTVSAGEQHAVFFKIRNMSNQAVKIVGADSSCTCVVADQLPVNVPPHGVFRLRIGVHPKKSQPGQIAEHVSLITDLESQQRLNLKISGRTVARSGPSTAKPAAPG